MINILLIEDDITLSMCMKYALESEGFTIHTADSVESAKNNLNNLDTIVNLVLLDVMLPDGNGYDLCKYIRSKNSNIPIIFLTACDEEANIVLGLDLGGDDYITKPVRIRELISRINAVLRRNSIISTSALATTPERTITSKALKLYPLKCKLLKHEEEISLTSIEYKLLLTLMNNSGNILTRNTLLEKLWDLDGEFIDNNTLSVYIRRLREKIEDNPKSPSYILTQRGVGYKWNEPVKGAL
ncbi:response regulator transcription factor [Clostridium botulinum]|uniref:response regulator transcription factor n=1 Tax=Clostridium botulinum TaxID=1491 RepID=UPI0006A40AF3|nr:response regulator transcription factor [Clostridium botulinum]KOC47903.1 transcriptional regulator [Clostridium botulinum]